MSRIEKAFRYENRGFEDVPLLLQTNSYWLTGHDPQKIPEDYFDNPESMYTFQLKGIHEHLAEIDDDYIPYLMPWYGVALMPGVFGSEVRFPKTDDPWCASQAVTSLEKARELKLPDLKNHPLTSKVLDTIAYFKEKDTFPVGVTDMQSPLDSLSLTTGYDKLFYWMKDSPGDVDHLFEVMTDTLIEWVKMQKSYSGESLECSNGLINVKPPDGIGIWFSDDDAVILSPWLYERFVVKPYCRLFTSFGSGMIHWCGDANHQLDHILNIDGIRAVHDYFLADIEMLVKLQTRLKEKRICLVAGDIIPVDEQLDQYLQNIKSRLDPVGLVLQFTVSPRLGLRDGKYTQTSRNVKETAKRILEFFRG
jgi:uroporphyrinogen-III decarboxylase